MEIETAPRKGAAPSRREWLLVALLSVVLAVGFAALAAPKYRFTGDTEHYVTLARTIATGAPYEVNGRPETKFPPGLPLLLAPAALIARGSFAAISRWAAFLASSVFLLTWLYVRRREPRFALPVAILTACCIPFLNLATGNVMSEPVYLALTLALLLWADRWYGPDRTWRSWGWTAIGGLLLMALPAVRTIGVAGVAAAGMMLVAEALQRDPSRPPARIRGAVPFAVGAGFVAAWLLWTKAHSLGWFGPDSGYFRLLVMRDPHEPDLGSANGIQFLGRIVRNFVIQTAHAGELLTPVTWVKPGWVSPALLAVPVLAAGWWQELRATGRFGALYFVCYMGILLLWPYDEGARFLLPVVPLLWVYLLAGLRQFHRAIRMHPGRVRVVGTLWSATAAIVLAISLPVTPLESSRQVTGAFVLWTLLFLTSSVGWNVVVRLAHGWGAREASRLTAVAVPLFVIASLAQIGPVMLERARGVPEPSENATALREAAEWIIANTPPEAVIQTTYTTRINFATGRVAVPFPRTRAPERYLDVERRYHPDFLLIVESNDRFYVPSDEGRFALIDSLFPHHWQLVHRVTRGRIYGSR